MNKTHSNDSSRHIQKGVLLNQYQNPPEANGNSAQEFIGIFAAV